MHSFAHFVGTISTSIGLNSISSHSGSCNVVQHSYVGSWIVGPGALDDVTSDLTQVHNLKPLSHPVKVTLPDGYLKTILQTGQLHLF